MIALNGACLVDTSGMILHSAAIEPDISLSLRHYLESQNDIEIHYYSGFDWFTGPNVNAGREAANIGFHPSLGPDVDGCLKLHKIMIVAAPSRLGAVDAWLRGQSLPLVASRSSIDYLEITASAATKGSAMLALANRFSLDLTRCIAIGDGDNDLSLFDVCGTGVAMANASERLRAAADVTIGANDDNGVHLYISKLFSDHGKAQRSQSLLSPHRRAASRS
jgi:hydroxymethylpyrimidine pyrophosphatase-like HAD family hydrolase